MTLVRAQIRMRGPLGTRADYGRNLRILSRRGAERYLNQSRTDSSMYMQIENAPSPAVAIISVVSIVGP